MTRFRLIRAGLVALACLAAAPAAAQELGSNLYSFLSTVSNNCTLVYGGNALLKTINVGNTTGTGYVLKIYDKRTVPVASTDTPVMRIPVPANTNGGGVVSADGGSAKINLGLGFCLVLNLADGDNTNAAVGVAINFSVIWQ